MKKVYFVRHAKSSWQNMELSDHDRPLNNRGKRDAPLMVKEFYKKEKVIPLLISSTAKRALTTAKVFAKELDIPKKNIIKDASLYHGGGEEFSNVVFQQDDEIDSLMIFGHNPGMTYFANEYTTRYIDNIPTTGIFKLESSKDQWPQFFDDAKLTLFIYPKMFL